MGLVRRNHGWCIASQKRGLRIPLGSRGRAIGNNFLGLADGQLAKGEKEGTYAPHERLLMEDFVRGFSKLHGIKVGRTGMGWEYGYRIATTNNE